MVLKCDVFMTITEMQKQFGLPDKDINDFLELLLAEQLVLKKNVTELSLTKKGEDTLSQLWTVVENTEKNILSDFSNDETLQLLSFLKRINGNCLSIMNKSAV
jgi:DNA-binding MarR family transcriptional regulator